MLIGEIGEMDEIGDGVETGDCSLEESLEASESSAGGAGGIKDSIGGGAGKGFCRVDLRMTFLPSWGCKVRESCLGGGRACCSETCSGR